MPWCSVRSRSSRRGLPGGPARAGGGGGGGGGHARGGDEFELTRSVIARVRDDPGAGRPAAVAGQAVAVDAVKAIGLAAGGEGVEGGVLLGVAERFNWTSWTTTASSSPVAAPNLGRIGRSEGGIESGEQLTAEVGGHHFGISDLAALRGNGRDRFLQTARLFRSPRLFLGRVVHDGVGAEWIAQVRRVAQRFAAAAEQEGGAQGDDGREQTRDPTRKLASDHS